MDVSTTQQVDNLDELMNNPELLQQIIDDLPGGEKKDEEGNRRLTKRSNLFV
ncbi:hypothetical protein OESDEN_17582 [Oesophagostomum dentatum]|uniref:Uncharacterized protein n=1 Tax=Oesophagostomum dentatum TaxID=61180 RepID=A0A0B1SGS4_OESDE|nr:hypothetical protein OESDEN_17582 [Oesophagostomum dentatum]